MEREEQQSIPHHHISADIMRDFKRMVTNIAEEITEDDFKKMRYYRGMDNEKTTLDMLRKLEQRGEFSKDNIGPLEELLKSINRCDLVSKYIDSYKKKLEHHAVAASTRSLSSRPTSFPGGLISKTSAHVSQSDVLKHRSQTAPSQLGTPGGHDQCPQHVHTYCSPVPEEESSNQFSTLQPSGMQHSEGVTSLVPLRMQKKHKRQQKGESEINSNASRSETPSTLCSEQYYCNFNTQPTRPGTSTSIRALQEQLRRVSLGSSASSMASLYTTASSSDYEQRCGNYYGMDEYVQELQSCPDLNGYRMWSSTEMFLLNREEMATMIVKHKTSRYDKLFTTTIPMSQKPKKGIRLTFEIFPYGRATDIESRHATVLVQASRYPSSGKHSKYREIIDNCTCMVEVTTTFNTQESLSTSEGKAELGLTSGGACILINQALSHNEIVCSKTDKIQMEVKAVLRCQDKIVTVPCNDPDCSDYMFVTPNE